MIAAAAVAGTLLATPAAAGPTATVNVVHGIPGVKVAVCVDGAKVVDDYSYRSKIVGAALPAGTRMVKLVAAGKDCDSSAILKKSFMLEAGGNYTIVANLNADGEPNLRAFANRVSPTGHGEARLTVRHTAAAPAVNVWADGGVLIGGDDFTWGSKATVMVPADTYTVKVTLPGKTAPVIGPRDLKLSAGKAYQVFAVGAAGSYSFVVIATPVGQR
jgi:hypothetical protein